MWFIILCLVVAVPILCCCCCQDHRRREYEQEQINAQQIMLFQQMMAARQRAAMANENGSGRKSNKKSYKKRRKGKNQAFRSPSQVNRRASPPDTNHRPNLARILRRLFETDELGGVILHNPTTQQSHAIEFFEPYGRNGVSFEFVASPDLERAKIFLRGETYSVIRCDDAEFEGFTLTLRRCCRSKGGLVDVGSGCPIFEGNLDY